MEADLKAVEGRVKDRGSMNEAEKQKMIMQISAVQTELKQTLDARYFQGFFLYRVLRITHEM